MPSAKQSKKPAKKSRSRKPKLVVSASPEPSSVLLNANETAIQMNRLIESMETYTKHRIECWLCQETESDRDCTENQFARMLYKIGWRYKGSDYYQTIGPMCPKCAKKTEADLKADVLD